MHKVMACLCDCDCNCDVQALGKNRCVLLCTKNVFPPNNPYDFSFRWKIASGWFCLRCFRAKKVPTAVWLETGRLRQKSQRLPTSSLVLSEQDGRQEQLMEEQKLQARKEPQPLQAEQQPQKQQLEDQHPQQQQQQLQHRQQEEALGK